MMALVIQARGVTKTFGSGVNAVQALLYTVLLAAAAMFDFSRRNL